jgi:transcriptional regulator with XRE-family HTH domain
MYFKNIENLRIDTDRTQAQVALYLHCKRDVYRRYEKGIHDIPVWALIKLAELYGVSTDYLLGLTKDKKQHHL